MPRPRPQDLLEGNDLSSEIQSRVVRIVTQLQLLNQRLLTIVGSSRSVGPAIGREIIGEAAGAIAEGVFESNWAGDLGYSLAKKWAAQKHAEQIESQRASIEYDFNQIAAQATQLLSTVSVDSPSLKPPGNSDQLVRKMKRIAGYAKTETKVVRAIQFFQSLQQERLILNSEIPEVVSARRPGYQEAYELLRRLEGALRGVIEESLSRVSPNWWNERILGDVRERAEKRKQQSGSDLHPIHYVDFSDYVKIIRKRDNWRDAFHKVFKDEESISVKLRELEPIRNALAHSRPLPKGSLERLRVNAKDILWLMSTETE